MHGVTANRQNGRITLYLGRVSPGPFELRLGRNVSGNFGYRVRESDGSVRTGQVNLQRPLYGGAPGTGSAIRWPPDVAAAGTRTAGTIDFLLGRPHGEHNNTSLYGEIIASTGDYQSAALGSARIWGCWALSVCETSPALRCAVAHMGRSSPVACSINYAKTFDKTGSTTAFGSSRCWTAIFCPHAGVPAASGHRRSGGHGMKTELHRDLASPFRYSRKYERPSR